MNEPNGVKSLHGRVVLVTGGGRGIGRATVELLLERGAKVGILELRSELGDELAARHDDLLVLQGDAGSRKDLIQAARKLRDVHGRLDAIVTNAISASYGSVTDVRDEDLDVVLSSGLKQVFWAAQAAVECFSDEGGTLVNLVSPLAFVGVAGTSKYTAVKGAVAALTRELAVELGPSVRVNAVLPGGTETEGAAGMGNSERNDRRIAVTPLRRRAQPIEVAKAIAFMVSDDASYMTGGIIPVDGGITIAGQ